MQNVIENICLFVKKTDHYLLNAYAIFKVFTIFFSPFLLRFFFDILGTAIQQLAKRLTNTCIHNVLAFEIIDMTMKSEEK